MGEVHIEKLSKNYRDECNLALSFWELEIQFRNEKRKGGSRKNEAKETKRDIGK